MKSEIPTSQPKAKHKQIVLMSLGIAVLAIILACLTANLIDESERHIAKLKEIHVSGVESQGEKESDSDIAAREAIEKHLQDTSMSLSGFDLTDRGLFSISKMKHLQRLDLSFARISNNALQYLTPLPLNYLNLSETSVGDDGMEYLAKIPTLANLVLAQTEVGDRGLHLLKNLPLADLSLTTSKVTDRGIASLEGQQKLWKLGLGSTLITDACLPSLAKIESLSWLELGETGVTINGLKALRNHKNLASLIVPNCNLTDNDVQQLANNFPHLDKIDISGNKITDKSLAYLAKVTTLRKLWIQRCPQLSKPAVESFRKTVPQCLVIQ
ncbi:MAG: hypothetical protein HYX67_07620 [Candidatus Melainabacteria bacterium]|nr:hypothetical protein [Candidatus Melainabacteria bacterium]